MSKWIKPLLHAEQYEVVERAGLVAIVHRAQAMPMVSDVQAARVEALLALGRHERALAEAKSYYNVATLKQTPAAIDLLAIGLREVRGKQQPGIATRFRQQQVARATAPDRAAANEGQGVPAYFSMTGTGGAADNLLKSIKVDAAPYREAMAKYQGDAYADLMARGNLWLLTDEPIEAKKCFSRAAERETTRGKDLTAALEGVARAIRAEDGAVGRANAFVLALQGQQ